MESSALRHYFLIANTEGEMEEPDAIGQAGVPGEGPYMLVALRMDGDRIAEARFRTYGCPTCIACGSFLTRWVTCKTVEQALVIEPGDLARVLGGVPLGKEHCPKLAVSALKDALEHLTSKDVSEGGAR